MHVVKGGRIYQTFFLAKFNESGGKKSRIRRRSKEERKEMVVSFIKKYQSLNNGSFPSLSLTHKEVGGSFYIVRDIVRDVIQENRVLGPAKLLQREHNNDEFLEQYPLGTISTQPHSSSSMSPNGSPFTPDQQESMNDDHCFISDGHSVEAEFERFENWKTSNGYHGLVKSTELVKQSVDGQVSEMEETDEYIKGVTLSKVRVTPIADAVVDTFPARPIIKQTEYWDRKSGELQDLNRTLEEKDVKTSHCGPGNDASLPHGLTSSDSTFTVYDEEENLAGGLSERNCDLIDGKLTGNSVDSKLESLTLSTSLQDIKYEKEEHVLLEKSSGLVVKSTENQVDIRDPTLKGSNLSTTKEGYVHEESADALLDSQSVENLVYPNSASAKASVVLDTQFNLDIEAAAENLFISAPNRVEAKPLNHTYASGKTTAQYVLGDSNAGVQHAGGSMRGNNPTLTRIHLESWQGASRNSKDRKPHSLWAICKSSLAALMKFLSQ